MNRPQALSREDRPASGAPRLDPVLLYVAVLATCLGLVMVASASMSIAEREYGDPFRFFWRQAGFLVIGVAVAAVAIRVPLSRWQAAGPFLLMLSAVLLVIVLVPGLGREVKGSARWIAVGPLTVQPSELVKVFWVIYLAGYLVRRHDNVQNRVSGFFVPIGVLSAVAVLLLLEPDYGATAVLFAVTLAMLFIAGAPFLTFITWGTVIGLVFAAMVVMAPYRLQRFMIFLDPWADRYGGGFQLTQALIAIGRGEWFGVGLGQSMQKLFYLPEAHNDFLFSVLAEELGLIGSLFVVVLFATLMLRTMWLAGRAEREGAVFAAYLLSGLGLLIGLQAFLNIGVNTGLLPTKGLNLPLVSAGGSSLVANCLAMGLLCRAALELGQRRREQEAPQ